MNYATITREYANTIRKVANESSNIANADKEVAKIDKNFATFNVKDANGSKKDANAFVKVATIDLKLADDEIKGRNKKVKDRVSHSARASTFAIRASQDPQSKIAKELALFLRTFDKFYLNLGNKKHSTQQAVIRHRGLSRSFHQHISQATAICLHVHATPTPHIAKRYLQG